jgi:hypothetical protein
MPFGTKKKLEYKDEERKRRKKKMKKKAHYIYLSK